MFLFFFVSLPRQSGGSTLVLGHALGRREKKPFARFFSVDRDWGCMQRVHGEIGCGFENPVFGCFQKLGYPKMDGL